MREFSKFRKTKKKRCSVKQGRETIDWLFSELAYESPRNLIKLQNMIQ